MADRLQLARESYLAYASGNRARIEELIAADLAFYSPVDQGIDRGAYFER